MSKANKEYFRKYYHKKKAKYINLLGGKCAVCSTKEGLEFDHKDPKTKEFTISKLMNYSEEKVLDEVRKCQLLCKACHLAKSQKEGSFTTEPWNKGKWSHGSQTGYLLKMCRCLECKDFYSEYKRRMRKERGWK
jgi:5-methylcytosine-specific restriction endonuclease McrA